MSLPAKCTGVFPQQVDATHPLTAGLEPPVLLPHSRSTPCPPTALVHAGYQVALQSDAVGGA